MFHFGVRALSLAPFAATITSLTCYIVALQREPILQRPCVEEGIQVLPLNRR